MRDWTRPATTLLLASGLWMLCLFLYLSHIPVSYTYDGMIFSSRIENLATPLYDLFHPHHLLYTILGRWFFLWGKDHGASWDGLVCLQFFDMLTGSLGVLIAFHLLVRETNDRLIAFLTALGLAFTFSYWYFSTSPGVRILATVTPLFAWYVLTWLKKAPAFAAIGLGLAHTLAVLGHQTNLLLIPAFLGGLWCLRERSLWDRLKMSLYYLSFLAAGVLTAYAFVGRFIFYKKTYEAWLWWVFAYFHVQSWGGYAASEGFQQGKFAMLQAFLIKNRPGNVAPSLTTEIAQTLFLYVLLALLGSLILRIGSHWSRNRQVLWVSSLWIGAFVPFFIWWEPWNIEFWVSSTAPCWILIGTVVADLSIRWRNPVLHFANRSFVLLVWTGVIALLFLYNFQERGAKVPHGPKPILDAIQSQIKPDDLLILDGINTIPLYLDRYQKRNYLNLHAFFRKYQPKTGEAAPAVTQRPADPWKDLKGLVEQSWKRRHRVWVLVEVVDENDGWYGKFERLMQFPMGQLSTFFHQYDLTPVPYNGNVYYYELKKPVPKQDP